MMTFHVPPGKPGGGGSVLPEWPDWAIGWVYLIGTSAGYQKLGFSTHPERRFAEATRLPFECWLEHEFPVGSRNVETRLHRFFEPRRCRGEWYALGSRGMALVKTITEARSTASLPDPFDGGRFVAHPGACHASWSSTADAFGFQLASLRMQAGLTIAQLADLTGLTPFQLWAYETGTSPHLSWHEVVRLADGLKVSTDAFRGATGWPRGSSRSRTEGPAPSTRTDTGTGPDVVTPPG